MQDMRRLTTGLLSEKYCRQLLLRGKNYNIIL